MIARCLFALALAAAAPDAAALYKWVDEKGVTQYTQEPPPDRKATKVEIKTAPSSAPADSPEDWKQREYELRKKRLDKERAEDAEKARAEADVAGRRNRCLRAQRAIDRLGSGPVFRINERGERVFLEDKERASELAEWRELARVSCDTR